MRERSSTAKRGGRLRTCQVFRQLRDCRHSFFQIDAFEPQHGNTHGVRRHRGDVDLGFWAIKHFNVGRPGWGKEVLTKPVAFCPARRFLHHPQVSGDAGVQPITPDHIARGNFFRRICGYRDGVLVLGERNIFGPLNLNVFFLRLLEQVITKLCSSNTAPR